MVPTLLCPIFVLTTVEWFYCSSQTEYRLKTYCDVTEAFQQVGEQNENQIIASKRSVQEQTDILTGYSTNC